MNSRMSLKFMMLRCPRCLPDFGGGDVGPKFGLWNLPEHVLEHGWYVDFSESAKLGFADSSSDEETTSDGTDLIQGENHLCVVVAVV